MQQSMWYGHTERLNTVYSMLNTKKGVFLMLRGLGFLDPMCISSTLLVGVKHEERRGTGDISLGGLHHLSLF